MGVDHQFCKNDVARQRKSGFRSSLARGRTRIHLVVVAIVTGFEGVPYSVSAKGKLAVGSAGSEDGDRAESESEDEGLLYGDNSDKKKQDAKFSEALTSDAKIKVAGSGRKGPAKGKAKLAAEPPEK